MKRALLGCTGKGWATFLAEGTTSTKSSQCETMLCLRNCKVTGLAGMWTAGKWGLRIQVSSVITSVKLLCKLPGLSWGPKETPHGSGFANWRNVRQMLIITRCFGGASLLSGKREQKTKRPANFSWIHILKRTHKWKILMSLLSSVFQVSNRFWTLIKTQSISWSLSITLAGFETCRNFCCPPVRPHPANSLSKYFLDAPCLFLFLWHWGGGQVYVSFIWGHILSH